VFSREEPDKGYNESEDMTDEVASTSDRTYQKTAYYIASCRTSANFSKNMEHVD